VIIKIEPQHPYWFSPKSWLLQEAVSGFDLPEGGDDFFPFEPFESGFPLSEEDAKRIDAFPTVIYNNTLPIPTYHISVEGAINDAEDGFPKNSWKCSCRTCKSLKHMIRNQHRDINDCFLTCQRCFAADAEHGSYCMNCMNLNRQTRDKLNKTS